MEKTPGIYEAAARWDDDAAMKAFLAPLPAEIAANIQDGRVSAPGGFSGMRHDETTQSAFYLQANDTTVEIFTIVPCSFDEAVAIYATLDEGPRPIDVVVVKAAFERATGLIVDFVQ